MSLKDYSKPSLTDTLHNMSQGYCLTILGVEISALDIILTQKVAETISSMPQPSSPLLYLGLGAAAITGFQCAYQLFKTGSEQCLGFDILEGK